MAKISFSTRPQKKYYSYVSDGHIYSISSKRPTVVGDGGGFYCCFFECEPYHIEEDVTYPLYEKIVKGTVSEYKITSVTSFNSGNEYYYTIDGSNYIKHEGQYCSKNGQLVYDMPQSAEELPHVVYKNEVRYFDTLIVNGATYKDGVFTPMDVNASGETTYGDILLDMVKESISIYAFNNGVAELPEYLKGDDITKEYAIESISYNIPANYFIVYGELFVEKLNNEMVKEGESIISRYESKSIETKYKSLTITSNITDSIGTITNTPNE